MRHTTPGTDTGDQETDRELEFRAKGKRLCNNVPKTVPAGGVKAQRIRIQTMKSHCSGFKSQLCHVVTPLLCVSVSSFSKCRSYCEQPHRDIDMLKCIHFVKSV